jgi:hypothetical protein
MWEKLYGYSGRAPSKLLPHVGDDLVSRMTTKVPTLLHLAAWALNIAASVELSRRQQLKLTGA